MIIYNIYKRLSFHVVNQDLFAGPDDDSLLNVGYVDR
jgi:hypothetical protein